MEQQIKVQEAFDLCCRKIEALELEVKKLCVRIPMYFFSCFLGAEILRAIVELFVR